MKQVMKLKTKMAAMFTGMLMALCALTACASTTDTNGTTTTTISTTTLEADTAALITLVNNVMKDTDITSQMSADDLTTMNKVESTLSSVESSIAASTSGTVSITTGKEWVASISTEIDTALDIAQPLVAKYDPSAVRYLDLASSLLPFIEAIVDVTTSSTAYPKHAVGVVQDGHLVFGQSIGLTDAQIRQQIYEGIQK